MTVKYSVFLFLAAALLLMNPGCSKDSNDEEPEIPGSSLPEHPSGPVSPYALKVFDYTPAPGQFINDERAGGMPEHLASPKEAAEWAESRLSQQLFVSLGGFGGYIVLGFDHQVKNSKGDYDFAVCGNAFLDSTGAGGSSEPGIVYVMRDENGNGLPDDKWYELKGSEFSESSTIKDYSVTYTRPSSSGSPVEWTDNLGNSGTIDYLGSFHSQYSYYPSWIDTESYTLKGTCLKSRTKKDESGFWVNGSFGWGYADNMGSDNSSIEGMSQANRFRISDAVDENGNPVDLQCIDFVKVQTGVNSKAGPLGEVSTEVLMIYDLGVANSDGTLFILNEGNFQYGNASLSVYDPSSKIVVNEAFIKANGMKLGDVAQSMEVHGNLGWIVVNNSHVVFAVDAVTLKERGRIDNLTSPRYIHFVDDTKAYVSQLWDNRITIINPSTYQVIGFIDVPDMATGSGSTEQMVTWGDFVYCNCWSYQNRIIKIDTRIDKVVESLEVGIQPNSLAIDRNGKLWTVTDGGYDGSPFGYEAPALVRIDADSFKIEKRFEFKKGESCSEICLNGDGSLVYWINDDIWEMDVTAEKVPSEPFLKAKGTIYYGLTVAPRSGDVYIADAIDYQQSGMIYRYSNDRRLVDSFSVGITPGAFCWYRP